MLLLIPAVVACSGRSVSPDQNDSNNPETVNGPPVKMSFDEALKTTSEERKLVEVEGYVELAVATSYGKKGQTVDFFGRKNQTKGRSLFTYIPIGDQHNSMRKLPNKYRDSHVEIIDDKGLKMKINERMRATGYIYALKSVSEHKPYTVYFEIEKIEKIPEVEVNYAAMNLPVLTQRAAKDEMNYDQLFKLEGMFEIPSFILIDNQLTIDFVNPAGKKMVVKLLSGKQADQMEPLRDDWAPKDVKIHTNTGDLVDMSKNVTVYGTLGLDGLHIEEIDQ